MAGIPTDYGQFLHRYNHLRHLLFSPQVNSRVDEDGEELPSCHPGRSEVCKMIEEMGLRVPVHRLEPPTLRNGTVLPNHVPDKA